MIASEPRPGRDYAAVIASPTASEDRTITALRRAMVALTVYTVVRGTTPSVTWTVLHAADRSASGTSVASGTTTSESGVSAVVTVAIPAGSYLWVETSATSGTVDEFAVTVSGR